jgi:nucleotide-binding universal stress UspA family protein
MPTGSTSPAMSRPSAGIKHILVAVDESDQASFALECAAGLAVDLSARLSIVHVVHLPPNINPELAYLDIAARPKLMEEGKELLDRAVGMCPPGTDTSRILREGDPATELADAAIRFGADLVVVGTHARGRFASAVIGSVAQSVMRTVPCPVLCVAHKFEPASASAERLASRDSEAEV